MSEYNYCTTCGWPEKDCDCESRAINEEVKLTEGSTKSLVKDLDRPGLKAVAPIVPPPPSVLREEDNVEEVFDETEESSEEREEEVFEEEKPRKLKYAQVSLKDASIVLSTPTRVVIDKEGKFSFSAVQTDEWQEEVEAKVAEIGLANLEDYVSITEQTESGLAGTRNGRPCIKAKKLEREQ